jgi:hypothetical protein
MNMYALHQGICRYSWEYGSAVIADMACKRPLYFLMVIKLFPCDLQIIFLFNIFSSIYGNVLGTFKKTKYLAVATYYLAVATYYLAVASYYLAMASYYLAMAS